MKKSMLLFALSLSAAALVAADKVEAKDPAAPFHDYGAAMSSTKEMPLTVNWQDDHKAELTAAVKDEVLAAFVKDEASARALLAQIKPAYVTDPKVAIQIAAVTQWTMLDDDVAWYDFWSATPHADGRKVWVKALIATAEESSNAYAQMLCLDQLRWCGCDCPCAVKRVRAIGEAAKDQGVKDLADMAARAMVR